MKTMLSVFIDGFLVEAFVGVYPREMESKQKLLIDCRVWFARLDANQERQDANQNESKLKPLDEVIDYSKVVNKIENIVCKKHWYLLEDLAQAIAEDFLKGEKIYRIKLKLSKIGINKKTDKIGIILDARL